jgi:acyl-CoA dehydrogenase
MTELNTELFDLTMSEKAKPLFERVKKHLEENVAPWQEEFEALNKEKTDRWTWHPRQLELLEAAKAKAREAGLWNFFLPDAETGEGLKQSRLCLYRGGARQVSACSETMNCSAPDTGNMEVLERVGTPAQKEQVAEAAAEKARSAPPSP